MTRGEATSTRVHFRGASDDFVVFVDDATAVKQWKLDHSAVPLSHFVSSFQVFITNKHGPNGQLNEAPRGVLDSEFGTHDEDKVIERILTEGSMQERDMQERNGPRNVSQNMTR